MNKINIITIIHMKELYQPTGIIVQSSGIVAHLLTGLDLSWWPLPSSLPNHPKCLDLSWAFPSNPWVCQIILNVWIFCGYPFHASNPWVCQDTPNHPKSLLTFGLHSCHGFWLNYFPKSPQINHRSDSRYRPLPKTQVTWILCTNIVIWR